MLQEAVKCVEEFMSHKRIPKGTRLKPLGRPKGSRRIYASAHNYINDFPELANAIESMRMASQRALRMFEVMVEHSKHDYTTSQSGVVTQEPPDLRFLRFNLIAEEVGVELLTALMAGDEIAALDALADGIYVLLGTAVTYDLPISEALEEVHRSNMSKAVTGPRLTDKGAKYSPPNLQKVLEDYRNGSV